MRLFLLPWLCGALAGAVGIGLLAVGWPSWWGWEASTGWQGGASVIFGTLVGFALAVRSERAEQ